LLRRYSPIGGVVKMVTQMTDHSRIETNPKIMFGKPVIKGTRITVEHILRMFAAAHTEESILEAHPHLTVEDIRAAQSYAADSLAHWRMMAAE
jgi:uncharacterized protein (DUF433 family)